MSKVKKQNNNDTGEEINRYFDDVCESANDTIVNNERVIDIQGIVITFGVLAIIFSTSQDSNGIVVLKPLTAFVSAVILILSIGIPMYFIRQNRRMINRLADKSKNGEIKEKSDIEETRNEYVKDGTHGRMQRLAMSYLEFVRFILLLLFIILTTPQFFLYILH